jgi:dihydroorotate dehydrogenase electron transfer subunit
LRMPEHYPRPAAIERVLRRDERTVTLLFRDARCAEALPGQYVMLWVPGKGEFPLSLSHAEPEEALAGVTVRARSERTRFFLELKEGQRVGLRGPLGTWFTAKMGEALLVGGGTGLAPLLLLARQLARLGSRATLIAAARTSSELLFREELEALAPSSLRLLYATEDGTAGVKGLATDVLEAELEARAPSALYACGPEPMVARVVRLALGRGIYVEASLERPFKCAMGACGACALGGFLLCKEGPVLGPRELALASDELGIYTRDHAGRRVSLHG